MVSYWCIHRSYSFSCKNIPDRTPFPIKISHIQWLWSCDGLLCYQTAKHAKCGKANLFTKILISWACNHFTHDINVIRLQYRQAQARFSVSYLTWLHLVPSSNNLWYQLQSYHTIFTTLQCFNLNHWSSNIWKSFNMSQNSQLNTYIWDDKDFSSEFWWKILRHQRETENNWKYTLRRHRRPTLYLHYRW